MALIDCPECEGSVSENAKKCPHCGEQLKTPFKDAAIIIGGSIIGGILINMGHKLLEDEDED